MSTPDQLRWEADNAPRFATAAFAAALLTIGSVVAQAVTFQGATGDAEVLRKIASHNGGVLAGRVIQSVAVIALVIALFYLYKATLARRPEGGVNYFWPVAVLAAILLTVAAVSGYFDAVSTADDFISGKQTGKRAEELADDLSSGFTRAIGQAGGLCLGVTYLLLSLNAMRAGLLSRFMGILGIIAGVLVVIPILPGAFIQLFWIAALGALYLNRWPNGRGPAWSVVEAVPWPTAADIQAARQEAEAKPEGQPDTAPEAEAKEPKPRQRTSSKKKKRRRGH